MNAGGVLFIGLIINVVFAMVCASIAESKNRSGALWGVLGFFGGILVLVIILILEDEYVSTYSSAPRSGPMYPEPQKTKVDSKSKPDNKPKPVVKRYDNYMYAKDQPIRCTKAVVKDLPDRTTIQLKLKSYDKPLKYVKADLYVDDVFNETTKLQGIIFDIAEMDDNKWHYTKDVLLQTDSKMCVEHIVAIKVVIGSVVTVGDHQFTIDQASYTASNEPKAIEQLRYLHGDDVFSAYEPLESGFKCLCGHGVITGDVTCDYCHRSQEEMAVKVDQLAIVSAMKRGKTLEQVKANYIKYEETIPEALRVRVREQMEKDLYTKKHNGIHDEAEKIDHWIELIEGKA